MDKWDKRFREMANLIATWSKDTTKVGCIIVGPDKEIVSTGYNGFPPGVQELGGRLQRPKKYLYTSHSEENSIALAALRGTKLEGCTLYLSEGAFPCARCARLIIRSGIRRIVCSPIEDSIMQGDWKDEFDAATKMFADTEMIIDIGE